MPIKNYINAQNLRVFGSSFVMLFFGKIGGTVILDEIIIRYRSDIVE